MPIFGLAVQHIKVNSGQKACAKCLLKIEILPTTLKNKTKIIKMERSIGEKLKY